MFFEEISKIDKVLSKLTRWKWRISKLAKSEQKRGITIDTKTIKGIIRLYFKKLFKTNLKYLKELAHFLER